MRPVRVAVGELQGKGILLIGILLVLDSFKHWGRGWEDRGREHGLQGTGGSCKVNRMI